MNQVLMTQIVVLFIIMVNFLLMPFLSHKDIIFGVRVPVNQVSKPSIRKVRKKYGLLALITYSVIAVFFIFTQTVPSLITVFSESMPLLISIILILLTSSVYFYICHIDMKKLKSTQHWSASSNSSKIVVDTDFRKGKIAVKPVLFTLYIPVILITIVATLYFYDILPEVIITPNHMASLSSTELPKLYALSIMPITQVILLLLFFFVNYTIIHSKQSRKGRQYKKADGRYRYVLSLCIFMLGLGLEILFLASQFSVMGFLSGSTLGILSLAITLIFSMLILGVGLYMGQDGYKLSKGESSVEEDNTISENDDAYWKLGMFYYNKSDPAIFVSKRIGIGYTLNHARPAAWLFYLGIIIILVSALIGLT